MCNQFAQVTFQNLDWKKLNNQGVVYFGSSVAALRHKELTPEEKVNLAINMTDVVIQICANGIKDQNPGITKTALEAKLRERLTRQKRQTSKRENKTVRMCV